MIIIINRNTSCECVRHMTNRFGALPKEQEKRSISYQVILLNVSFVILYSTVAYVI